MIYSLINKNIDKITIQCFSENKKIQAINITQGGLI